ncbi:hypothetical protein BDW74DRAFT_187496 [Aspergillus multicolor]|uniref:uncharacterized protein n=1 Tax=Aspergillus multicolor TaxID=41759 RepID=UPI003CCD3FFE
MAALRALVLSLTLTLTLGLAWAAPAPQTAPDPPDSDSDIDINEIFRDSLSSGARIFLPDDPEYTAQITQRWSTYNSPSFIAAIKPATEKDAQTINVIDIDLGNFNTTDLDTEANTFTVGGATVISQIYQPLYDAGKELPSGDLLTVSDAENSDLFWAIRGAAANFGIITQATYRVHNATNSGQVVNADFTYSWDDEDSGDGLPPQMSLAIAGSIANGSASIAASIQFFGPLSDAQPYIDTFLDLNPTRNQTIIVPWPELSSAASFGRGNASCARGGHLLPYGVGFNATNASALSDGFAAMADFGADNIWYRGSFVVQRWSSAAARAVPESERAVYPWRDIKFQVLISHIAPNASYDDDIEEFAGPARDRLYDASGFEQPQTYVNYGHGDEGPEVWWGDNLPRLSALKREWDPEGIFGAGNPVPLDA